MQMVKKRKRFKKAAVLVLILLLLAALVVGWKLYYYVQIYRQVQTVSVEEIEQQAAAAEEALQTKMQQLIGQSAAEEGKAKTTPDAQGGKVVQAFDPQFSESAGEAGSAPPASSSAQSHTAALQKHYAALESAQAVFSSKLGSIVQAAKSEFYALPAKERTTEAKINVVMSKSGALHALQSQSDAKVASEVKSIREILKKSGQDTSLADEIQSAYEGLKSAKIAEYMSKLYS